MDSRRTFWSLARMLLAGVAALLVMLVVLLSLLHLETGGVAATRKPDLLLNVIVTSAVGLAVYLAAAWAMRVGEVSDVLSLGRRMIRRAR